VSPEAPEPVADRLTVPSLPASIASVRRFAVRACLASGNELLCDTVALLVSEVATNALVHGSGDVEVRVTSDGPVLRVEVSDDSPQMPRRRAAGLLEEGGRGLALVDSLSRDWGVERHGEGKVVWFELG
jgi:anti-sigma regulatory factor (Ser/Thr protein kinase)